MAKKSTLEEILWDDSEHDKEKESESSKSVLWKRKGSMLCLM